MTSLSTPNTISGRNAFIELLLSEGVTHRSAIREPGARLPVGRPVACRKRGEAVRGALALRRAAEFGHERRQHAQCLGDIGANGDFRRVGLAHLPVQALWTAARQKLPMIFVVFNNGGYRIIKQRLKFVPRHRALYRDGLRRSAHRLRPLARSLGMRAHCIDTGGEFGAACRDALAAREPVLLEVIVDASV